MPRTKSAGTAGEELSFDEALHRLEEVVNRLESGDLPLEQALVLFEQGTMLSAVLRAKLDAAQARIDRLVATRAGSKLEPMDGVALE